MKKNVQISGQFGFTLVELMVALTLGLIIMAAVSLMFVNTRLAYNVQTQLSRVQENGRFAMHFLMEDARMAGYLGCLTGRFVAQDSTGDPNVLPANQFEFQNKTFNPSAPARDRKFYSTLAGGFSFNLNMTLPFEGFDPEVSAGWWPSGDMNVPMALVPNTDMLTIRRAEPSSQRFLTAPMANAAAPIPVNDATGFAIGDIITVSDCTHANVTQITDVQTAPPALLHAAGGSNPGNATGRLSVAYGSDPDRPYDDLRAVKVFQFATIRYFIARNPNNIPSLFRDINGSGNPQELVEGIEDMQILYGIDTDTPADGIPNRYVRAGTPGAAGAPGLQTQTEWARVVSIRIGVLARSPAQANNDFDTNTYLVNDRQNVPGTGPGQRTLDRNQRRVFLSTVKLRNHSPTQ